MATSLSTPAAVEARRSALFAAEGRGEAVPESAWDEVAAAQRALDEGMFLPSGYIRGAWHG